MKTLITRTLILLAIILSVNSKAQTTVDLIQVVDSTLVSPLCPAPITVSLTAYGTVSGYNTATDSIELHYFWDDGSDTIFKTNLNSTPVDYFWTNGVPHIYTSPGIYDVMIVATGPDGTDDTLINAPITIYSGCSTVDGYSYVDNNSNCMFDAGDDTLGGIGLTISDALGNFIAYGYSNASGYYSTSVPAGLSGLQISAVSAYWGTPYINVICPTAGLYTFSSSTNNSFDFGFNCSISGYDLFTSHTYSGVGAPGSNGSISFYASNVSCNNIASTITLTLDPDISYVNMISGPPPSSVAGNVLTWNVPLGAGYYSGSNFTANINVLTSTTAVFMDTAFFNLSISPTASDLYVGNNTNNWYLLIGGPYDPNSKEVSPAGIGANGNIAPETNLTYTVNFQNTGTAPAINVYVMDSISDNLDMSTFHILASSHAMNPYFYEGNIVRFDYPNIVLPDSNASEPLSHGWVVYTVKAKSGLANGTQIKNTGHIFFDYNSAIVTNTTLNTIDMALGIEGDKNAMESSIYPNPSQHRFSIVFGGQVSGILSIVDMRGRIVKTINLSKAEQVEVDLENFPSGLYGLSIPGVQLKENRVQIIK